MPRAYRKGPRYEAGREAREETKKFKTALIKALSRKDVQGITALQHVADALVRNAILGKEASIAMIADRVDGKVAGELLQLDPNGPQVFEAIAIRAVYPRQIEHQAVHVDEQQVQEVFDNRGQIDHEAQKNKKLN